MKHRRLQIIMYYILLASLTVYEWIFDQLYKLPWVDTLGDIYNTLSDTTLDLREIRQQLEVLKKTTRG